MQRRRIPLVLLWVAIACSSGEAREAGVPTPPEAAGTTSSRVVDSILPLEEALRRFREDIPEVTAFEDGAPSRDALIDAFIVALRTRDSSALRTFAVSRAEFAWLYYPKSVFSRVPYYQMPQLNWSLHLIDSEKGISRALERFGGGELHMLGYTCPDTPRADGAVTFWDGCRVRVRHDGAERELRLFGSVAELGGRFKFYSYANDL